MRLCYKCHNDTVLVPGIFLACTRTKQLPLKIIVRSIAHPFAVLHINFTHSHIYTLTSMLTVFTSFIQSSDSQGTVTVKYRIGDQEFTNTVSFSLKPAENTG